MARVGGVVDSSGFQNSVEIDNLAIFAVEEHNKRENALLEFSRVVSAKEQVVAGKIHHLTVEVIEAGKEMVYEASVWVKSWENFKELQKFKKTDKQLQFHVYVFQSSHTTNLVEIAWENGQIMVQPQIQSGSKPPQSTGDTDFANTDVSWLTNYPAATDDYGIGFLSPEFTGDKSAASTSTSDKLQTTQDPTTTSGFLNFSNFSRPVALHKTNLQNAEKLIAPNPKDNASVVKWDEKGIISSGKETKVPEAALKRRIKKALPEGNDSCNQSKDPDDDSAGCAKKHATCSTSSTNKEAELPKEGGIGSMKKMKSLQQLIPNCNKVDKASMLDKAILQMMSMMSNVGGGMYMPHFPQMGVGMPGMGMLDVNGRSPVMPAHYHACSSIPANQYQSYGVPVVGHPVPSVANGSPYFPLPTHSIATTRMNFGPEVGVDAQEMV